MMKHTFNRVNSSFPKGGHSATCTYTEINIVLTHIIMEKTAPKQTFMTRNTVPIAQMVERPLREREVVGSNPGRAIPKA